MRPIRAILFSLVAISILGACDKQAKPTLILPDLKAYTLLTDAQLGSNENGKGLSLGSKVESVDLKTTAGKKYVLASAWQDKPALIIFYRGGWCPYCNMQMRELSQNHAKFDEAGIQLVAISVDQADAAALTSSTYQIPFPVLSDSELVALNTFNVAMPLDAETLSRYKAYGIVPSDWSGKNHNTIAVSSAFIIDTQGRVRFSHATSDYKSRPSPEQLLHVIELLKL